MLLATLSVIRMITGPITLGRMWCRSMARSRTPKARAASTNSRSRTDSTMPRTSRAYCTHCEMIMNRMMFVRPPPRMEMKVIATRMKGSASCTSTQRISSMSTKPR
jgi:hypothetical protein